MNSISIKIGGQLKGNATEDDPKVNSFLFKIRTDDHTTKAYAHLLYVAGLIFIGTAHLESRLKIP